MENIASHLVTLAEASAWHQQLRGEGKKLVVTNGCFDLMHRGHAQYLADARACGDALLVLLNSDASVRRLKGESRPIVSERDRAFLLASLRAVDRVVIFDSPRCDRELTELAPEVYVKAGDYTLEKLDPDERTALLHAGTRIVFMPFVAGLSTSAIIARIRAE